MLSNIILSFTKFPAAESIHLLQGAVAGYLLLTGVVKAKVAHVLTAMTIVVAFAIYEGYERWRIGDEADVDFQVALITAWLSAVITLVIHLVREHLKGEK